MAAAVPLRLIRIKALDKGAVEILQDAEMGPFEDQAIEFDSTDEQGEHFDYVVRGTMPVLHGPWYEDQYLKTLGKLSDGPLSFVPWYDPNKKLAKAMVAALVCAERLRAAGVSVVCQPLGSALLRRLKGTTTMSMTMRKEN